MLHHQQATLTENEVEDSIVETSSSDVNESPVTSAKSAAEARRAKILARGSSRLSVAKGEGVSVNIAVPSNLL